MLFNQAVEIVVKFAEGYAMPDHHSKGITEVKEAIARVRKWMDSGILPREENRPLTLILHPAGDIEITGATASEIKIDDRRSA